ncbi:hypothetical protein CHRYSEO8AT_510151 [Chryseobacterium sp. 8AT]|nr:hypothetical protein CHRYSEO8AT_510151 [Chryseobacterium sp. 8AT]
MVDGPFVYRLGPQIFILVRGVRFPYGLQKEISNFEISFFVDKILLKIINKVCLSISKSYTFAIHQMI